MNTNITQNNASKQNDLAYNMSRGVPLEKMSEKCIKKLKEFGKEKKMTKKEKKKVARKMSLGLPLRKPRYKQRFKRHYTTKLSGGGVQRKNTLKEQGIDLELSTDLARRGISDVAIANDTISNLVFRCMSEIRPINYAITTRMHPVKSLTIKDMNIIKEEIVHALLTYDHPKIRPKFFSIEFIVEEGWIRLVCAGRSTEVWIVSKRGQFEQKCGIELKIVPVSNLSDSLRFAGFFCNSPDEQPKTIFQMLQAQNAGLHIDKWKLVTQRHIKNGKHLLFDIDVESNETLKKNEYLLFYKFGSVHILPAGKLKDYKSPSESDDSGAEE